MRLIPAKIVNTTSAQSGRSINFSKRHGSKISAYVADTIDTHCHKTKPQPLLFPSMDRKFKESHSLSLRCHWDLWTPFSWNTCKLWSLYATLQHP